jgi:hypothetical protein
MSRVNHNAQYIYDVEGETIWEKLRVIRNQLEQRQLALDLSLLNKEKAEAKFKDDKESYEYREFIIHSKQREQLIQDCINEIEFLKEFESYLALEAEKTRIPGKTDDEMYELNFFEELKVRLVRRAQTQIISSGRVDQETLSRILKMPDALQLCITSGLLTNDVLNFTNIPQLPNNDITINYLEKKDD